MEQEYLVNEDCEKETISKHFSINTETKDELRIHLSIDKIPSAESWIAKFSTKSNGEDAAKTLSTVDEWIKNNTKCITLTNESSAYFNKTLFPLVNDFERKLRKLLYLMTSIHYDNESFKAINNLEDKDLGNIFELLFADKDFSNKVRQIVKNKTWTFSKNEIVNDINSESENILWNQLVGSSAAPSLSSNYIKVKDYRNDIMHAHNISYKAYSEIKRLYIRVNDELQSAIDKVVNQEQSIPAGFSESLQAALKEYTQEIDYNTIQEMIKSIVPTLEVFSDIIKMIPSSPLTKNTKDDETEPSKPENKGILDEPDNTSQD